MTALAAPARPRADRSWVTEWRRTVDWPILFGAAILLGFGLLLSLAAGPPAAARLGYSDPYFFVARHAVFAVGAACVLVAASLLDRQFVRRFAALVFVFAIALMGIILLAGHEAKGAQRWIRLLGFSFQPSEIVKPALLVLVAWLLAQRQHMPDGPWAMIAFCLYVVTLGLLILQPDVGQAALISAAFVLTFFVTGLPLRWAALFAGGGAVLTGALYATLPHVRQRLHGFVNPSAYDTYQIDKAAEALSRGGLLGAGAGEGTIKTSLPDAHTDFVYAVLGEEYGLVAALFVTLVFAVITLRGLGLAARVEDLYTRAAATGLFALFGLQAAINIGVNVALIPPKGMTLPFLSYGGSSMLGIALTLGFALALVRRAPLRRRPA